MTKNKRKLQTPEQFLELRETMINGNWEQAALDCVEYDFCAKDLREHYKSMGLEDNIWDYVRLAEMAERLRHN